MEEAIQETSFSVPVINEVTIIVPNEPPALSLKCHRESLHSPNLPKAPPSPAITRCSFFGDGRNLDREATYGILKHSVEDECMSCFDNIMKRKFSFYLAEIIFYQSSADNEAEAIIKSFMEYGMNIQRSMESEGKFLRVAANLLFLLVNQGCCNLVAIVLSVCGFLINETNSQGKTPIEIAMKVHKDDQVKLHTLLDVLLATKDLMWTEKESSVISNYYYNKLTEQVRFSKDLSGKVTMDLRYMKQLCETKTNSGQIQFLKMISKQKQKNILEHVMVQTYLYLTWPFFQRFYYFSLSAYMIQLALYTIFIYYFYSTDKVKPSTFFSTQIDDHEITEFERILIYFGILGSSTVYLIRSFWHIAKKCIFGSKVSLRQFILESIPMIMIPFTFLLPEDSLPENGFRAFAAFCAWLAFANTLSYLSYHPELGIYVEMISRVGRKFLKFFLTYICLILGFLLAFSILAKNQPPFRNILVGFIRLLRMLVGDVDINENEDFDACTSILFAIFVLAVTLFLANLLIGLAVYNMKELIDESNICRTVRQIQFMNLNQSLVDKIKEFVTSSECLQRFPDCLIEKVKEKFVLPECPDKEQFKPYVVINDPIYKKLNADAYKIARLNTGQSSVYSLDGIYKSRKS